MKTKHTPGPWWVEVGDTDTSVESKYFTIATDVSNDDANLIAAAPELLKALKQLEESFSRYLSGSETRLYEITEARAAINKAEGAEWVMRGSGDPCDLNAKSIWPKKDDDT